MDFQWVVVYQCLYPTSLLCMSLQDQCYRCNELLLPAARLRLIIGEIYLDHGQSYSLSNNFILGELQLFLCVSSQESSMNNTCLQQLMLKKNLSEHFATLIINSKEYIYYIYTQAFPNICVYTYLDRQFYLITNWLGLCPFLYGSQVVPIQQLEYTITLLIRLSNNLTHMGSSSQHDISFECVFYRQNYICAGSYL